MQERLWAVAAAALAVAVLAGLLDWLRMRRRNLEDPGWVPWRGIQIAGFFAALACAMLAMHV